MRACIDTAASRCLLVPGAGVDAAIGQLLLDTLTPLALEVAITVQTEIETRASEADALRRHNVERARHRADLARRRYLAVDPATGWSPTPWKPTGTTPCARCKPPKTTTRRPLPPRPPRSPRSTRPESGRWPATSPPCGQTRPPRPGNASA
jgi:hypothetical protein